MTSAAFSILGGDCADGQKRDIRIAATTRPRSSGNRHQEPQVGQEVAEGLSM
jgi:hypothetical protein